MKRCRNVGFSTACLFAYLESSCVSEGAPGRYALQRLYSTFPGGRPGIGLLLLRAAVGLTAIAQRVLYVSGLSHPSSGKWLLGVVLITSGAALAAGFFTPFAGLVVGLCFLGIALSWFPALPGLSRRQDGGFWNDHSCCRACVTRARCFFARWSLVRTPRNCDSAFSASTRIVSLSRFEG